jgi:hypothetical protein
VAAAVDEAARIVMDMAGVPAARDLR